MANSSVGKALASHSGDPGSNTIKSIPKKIILTFNINKTIIWAIGKSPSARDLTWAIKKNINKGPGVLICMWIPAAFAPSMESHRTTEVEQINKRYQVWMVELPVRSVSAEMKQE